MKIFCLALLFLSLPLFASEKLQIKSMTEVQDLLDRRTVERHQVLVVFDIDNTLLKMNQDLGSDAWFSWQEAKLKNQETQDLVAKDFSGLLRAQGVLYALSPMSPVEPETPAFFQRLQAQGYEVFLLTSRGLEFQSATERELSRNGYQAGLTAPGQPGGFAARYLPYDLNHPEEACLTRGDIEKLQIPPAKPVIYQNGVMYTQGQNKGVMLRTLLCKLDKSYKMIVFVDDMERHVDRVFKAYEAYNVDVRSLRYGAWDTDVARFQKADKSSVVQAWSRLRQTLVDLGLWAD